MTEGEETGRALRRRLALTLLADVDGLTRRVVADICEHSPAYASGNPVPVADLHTVCRHNVLLSLQAFGEIPASAGDIEAAATETGRRRAEQAMPLDTVLLAYRRGGRVLWQAMVDLLRGAEAAEQDAGLEVAGALWEIVDRFSTVMADAYRLTQLEVQSRQASRRGALFAALLEGRGRDPVVMSAAAEALGLPTRDRYALVVVDIGENPAAPPNPGPALLDAGMWSFWRPWAQRYAGLVRLGAAEPRELADVLRQTRVGTAGLSPVFEDPAAADTALRLAERALRTLPPDARAVACLDERLAEACLVADPEIADLMVTRYLSGVVPCGPESAALLRTLRVWLEEGCSVVRTAERIYCHRNTVLNRLARVAELTGWAVESGEARLGWALALRATDVPR